MEHFLERVGLSLLLTTVSGFFFALTFPPLSALSLTIAAFGCYLLLIFFGKSIYTAYCDLLERQHRNLVTHHEHRTKTQELKLKAQALDVQRLQAETARVSALIEAQIKQGQFQLEKERFTIEQSGGPVTILSTSEWMYKPLEDRGIAPPRPGHQRVEILPEPEMVYQPLPMEECLEQLRFNQLQVCMGSDALTGAPLIVDFMKGVHYKLIGSSGMGKSCGAAGKLHQLTQMNDPEHLMIALLDMEHMTSRLFEHCPHVAEIRHQGRYIPLIATDAEEVADKFMLLCKELDRRSHDPNGTRAPFLLIYVEEFLALKHALLDEKLKSRMLSDFTQLAVRGRKYHMYLLACAQDDYASSEKASDELRSARNQFQVREAYCVSPRAALSAGFVHTELIRSNYTEATRGKYVLEGAFGKPTLMLAPVFDVEAELERRRLLPDKSVIAHSEMFRPRSTTVAEGFAGGSDTVLSSALNDARTCKSHNSEGDFCTILRAKANAFLP